MGPPEIVRRIVLRTPAIRVDRVTCKALCREPTAEHDEPETKIVIPLAGTYIHHFGRRHWHIDANQIAFIPAGRSTRDGHPSRGDFECLTLRPAAELVEGVELPGAALADPELQLMTARLGARVADGPPTGRAPALLEELALQLVHVALTCVTPARTPEPAAARRLAERVKALLSPEGPPVRLAALARRLSVSPTYLTDAFRRAEGIPLARYQLRLRMARALAELPRCGDLARLALDLGFSSHSHFTTAFRAVMRLTPSEYRRQALGAIERF